MQNIVRSDRQVAIILLNWNGKIDTLECLRSLIKVKYHPVKIIVVDNASCDDSVAAIKTAYPDVTLLINDKNLGFAEGNNVGIRYALENGADFVLILNNDTVVDPSLIDALVKSAEENPSGGVFGPKIYYHTEPETIWYAGGRWDEAGQCFEQVGDGELDSGQYESTQKTEFVIGCAMFVRAEVFSKIGLFEKDFFLNYEEIDFCSRAKRHGYDCIYVPDAKLWHKIAASFGGEESPLKTYFTFRNRLFWAERNLSLAQRISVHFSIYSIVSRNITASFSNRAECSSLLRRLYWGVLSAARNPCNRARMYGVRDYWLRRFGNCPERVRELNREWGKAARG